MELCFIRHCLKLRQENILCTDEKPFRISDSPVLVSFLARISMFYHSFPKYFRVRANAEQLQLILKNCFSFLCKLCILSESCKSVHRVTVQENSGILVQYLYQRQFTAFMVSMQDMTINTYLFHL